MRYFNVEEARALIPDLEELFTRALQLRARAEAKAEALSGHGSKKAGAEDGAIARAQLQFLVNEINDCLQKVCDLGAVPKGLEPALVDFPHRLNGREVYLCWKLGDKDILHYHGIDEGFAGRKELPSKKPAV